MVKQAQASLIQKKLGHLEDIKSVDVIAKKGKDVVRPLDKYSTMLVVVKSSL